MLLTRTELARVEPKLTAEQQQRLYNADKRLLEQTPQFLAAIQRIASLEKWRQHHKAQISHWWWYLDVIAHISVSLDISVKQIEGQMVT